MSTQALSQEPFDSLASLIEGRANNRQKMEIYLRPARLWDTITYEVLKFYQDGLELAVRMRDSTAMADIYRHMGDAYHMKGQYLSAKTQYEESLEILNEIGELEKIKIIWNSLGMLSKKFQDHNDALEYFVKFLQLSRILSDTVGLASAYINIGSAFADLRQYDSALVYNQRGLMISRIIGDHRRMAAAELNLGDTYAKLQIRDSAILHFHRAVQHSKLSGWLPRIADSYYSFAVFHMNAGNYGLSEVYLDSARSYAEKANYIEIEPDISSTHEHLTLSNLHQKEKELEDISTKVKTQRFFLFFSIVAVTLSLFVIFFIYRNYRNKQKANRLLAEIDQLKTRMYTNISHELRTPLTLILDPLEEMMEEEAKKQPTRKTLAMMQRNASRLLQLVNQMLDLSKMDAGSLQLEMVEEDIVKDIRHIVLSFTTRAEQRQISYTHEILPPAFITWYDPDKLEKILVNLLSNAFKFTPEGGSVDVSIIIETDGKKPFLNIRVQDTGPGIPGTETEKIFERFHQVIEHASMDQAGTGIGLALVKELVDLMHGHVRVESTVGEGSLFIAEFPLGKEHLDESEYLYKGTGKSRDSLIIAPGEAETMDETEEVETIGGLPILLVVEDHEDIRRHIHDRLGEKYRVVEAGDGKEGYEKAVDLVPDIIITDLMMPVMDGVEMTRNLKTDERTSHIPIVMLTAKASVEDRIEGLETGADDYLTKPFHMKELAVRLQNLVEQRNLLRQKYRKELKFEPGDIAVNSADERFLEKTISFLEINLADPDLDIQRFHDAVGMSRMQFFRKIKALTDHSPNEFIRSFRLKRAAQLLEKGYGNVAQVTYEVGFNNLSYFAKCFREMFGKNPSEYLRGVRE